MNYEEIVLDAFRKINARVGHVVPIRNFRNGIMRQMNPIEQEEFIAVINAMITDGWSPMNSPLASGIYFIEEFTIRRENVRF